jgi:NAD(P)-dependent dehydrogenase (short-subunit alcohol dehydrogenase family)
MGKLDGKVALITGSGRNIGRATALKLAGEGAHIVVNARTNRAEADAVAREVRDLGVKRYQSSPIWPKRTRSTRWRHGIVSSAVSTS